MERKDLPYLGRSKGVKKHIRRILAEARREEASQPQKVELPARYQEIQKQLQRTNLTREDETELKLEEILWQAKLSGQGLPGARDRMTDFYDNLEKKDPNVYKYLVEPRLVAGSNTIASRASQIRDRVFPPKPNK